MLWVIVPAYNEETDLPRLLPKLDGLLRERGEAYRIVVINDGSTDGTAEVLRERGQSLPIDVVEHSLNRGLGETERDGFEYVASRAQPDDRIVRIEADDTHDPRYIGALLDRLEAGFDVVITSRFRPGGGQLGLDPYRSFISRAANLFMGLVYRIPGVRDYSCGFRAYRARVIQDALRVFGNNFIQLKGLGFVSTAETLVKLHLLGCRCSEVPFVLRYDRKVGASKMIGSVTTLGYLVMAILHYWPFGGWLFHYRGLRDLYRRDPDEAIRRFASPPMRQSAATGAGV